MATTEPTRILIVEDDALTALVLSRMVTEMGCQVVGHASTAPRAVALADHLRPDVVLVDVGLAKGTSGLEAARQMRNELKLNVVMISGHVPEDEFHWSAELPWVQKPFSAEQIRTAIQAVRSKRRIEIPLPVPAQITSAAMRTTHLPTLEPS